MKVYLLPVLLILCWPVASARGNTQAEKQAFMSQINPFSFIENKGQVTNQSGLVRQDIDYSLAAGNGLNIFIGKGFLLYQFSKADSTYRQQNTGSKIMPKTSYTMYRLDVELVGTNNRAEVVPGDKQDYRFNYNRPGEDKQTTESAFNRITYKNIYPDIDWVLYIKDGHLEHEFVVKEGGNPQQIQLKYGGAGNLQLNADGSLTASTPMGTVTEKAPLAFDSGNKTVSSGFKLNDNLLSYETGPYNGTLVIDPTLNWSTFFGGNNYDNGTGIATDKLGNVFLTGYTNSTNGVATSGAYQTTLGGQYSAFVARFSSGGSLYWATYFGKYGDTYAYAIAADTSGGVYITGQADSTGLAGGNAYQSTYGGGNDAFVAKFIASTGTLNWATYYGGPGSEVGNGIAADNYGYIYVAGQTTSATGIATAGSYQPALDSLADAFLVKFDKNGNRIWATYYGGPGTDYGVAVVTDKTGSIYLGGDTYSNTAIASAGAHQTTPGGGEDAFLAKFDSTGNRLWATYYGGQGYDNTSGIATNGGENIYLAGNTGSSLGIAYGSSYQNANAGSTDGFLAVFNTSGAIKWATYYGGTNTDVITSVAADSMGYIYIAGNTLSMPGIASPNAYDTVLSNFGLPGETPSDFFAVLDSMGGRVYGSYFGYSYLGGTYIATDGRLNLYLTGYTEGGSIPIVAPNQVTYGGGIYDAFLAKFSFCALPQIGPFNLSTAMCYTTYQQLLISNAPPGTWASSNTAVATVNASGYATAHSYGTVTFTYTTTTGCEPLYAGWTGPVSPSGTTGIIPAGPVINLCYGDSVTLVASGNGIGPYVWNTGATGAAIVVKQPGAYQVTDYGVCSSGSSTIDTVTVSNLHAVTATQAPDSVLNACPGQRITFTAGATASGDTVHYQWAYGTVPYEWQYYLSNNSTFSGVNTPVLTIDSTYNSLGGYYFVIMRTCDSVVLAARLQLNSSPEIIPYPGQNITIDQGYGATFGIQLYDYIGSFYYQWQVDSAGTGYRNVTNDASYAGATTDTLIINNAPAGFNGSAYRCIVSTPCGLYDTSAVNTLTVTARPRLILTQPTNITTCPGSGYLSVNGNTAGCSGLLYQWQGGSGGNFNQEQFTTQNYTYLYNPLVCGDQFRCILYCPAFNVYDTTNVITYNCYNVATITRQPLSVTVCENGSATFTVQTNSNTDVTYQWYGFGGPWTALTNGNNSGANVTGAQSNVLTISNIPSLWYGQIECIITDSCNVNNVLTTNAANLNINAAAASGLQLPFTEACTGETYTLSGGSPDGGTYSGAGVSGDNFNATTAGVGSHAITYSYSSGGCSSSAQQTVVVHAAPPVPVITQSNNLLTSSSTTGNQWYLNGTAIGNATGHELTAIQNGTYTVQVTSNGCTSTSSGVDITTLGINDVTAAYTVQLYPNPNNGNFTLQFSDNLPRSVSFTDVTGRLITLQQVSGRKEFDCTNLASGVYLAEIHDETGIKTLRVTIVR